MASYFLNSAKHITLLESDAEILNFFSNEASEKDNEINAALKKEVKLLNSSPKHY
jgi:hypothetical protein